MPLPVIIGSAALVVAGTGVKKAVDGFQKKSVANDIKREANVKYKIAEYEFNKIKKETEEHLTILENLKLKIGSDFAEFKTISENLIKKLEHSSNKNIRLNLPEHKLNQMGFDMAGGAVAILGEVAAASPVFAVLDFVFNNSAEKKLEQAKDLRKESSEVIKKLEIARKHLSKISSYAIKIQHALQDIYKIFNQYFNDLQKMDLFIRHGEDINKLDPIILNVVENGYLVSEILADIINTPLFKVKKDENGNPVLKDKVVQIEVDENGNQIINEEEIESDIQTALKNVEKFQ